MHAGWHNTGSGRSSGRSSSGKALLHGASPGSSHVRIWEVQYGSRIVDPIECQNVPLRKSAARVLNTPERY
jgi:hypothetical protein